MVSKGDIAIHLETQDWLEQSLSAIIEKKKFPKMEITQEHYLHFLMEIKEFFN